MTELMTLLISILGALAWIPHLWSLVSKKLVKAKISIFSDKTISIGFTELGPVINISIAILCERKSTLIKDITLTVVHETNHKTEFTWEQIDEELMDLTIPGAGALTNSRTRQAIALRIEEDELLERRFWFNSMEFQKQLSDLRYKFREVYGNHLSSPQATTIANLKTSSEYNNLVGLSKNAFPWRTGKYVVTIQITTDSDKAIDQQFQFFLNRIDQDELEGNIPLVKDHIEQEYFNRNLQVKDWSWAMVRRA